MKRKDRRKRISARFPKKAKIREIWSKAVAAAAPTPTPPAIRLSAVLCHKCLNVAEVFYVGQGPGGRGQGPLRTENPFRKCVRVLSFKLVMENLSMTSLFE